MSGPRPASMAAVNFGTRSAEVTVSATILMFGLRFSNSAKSVLSAGPAGSSPKYQLMNRSCTGAWALAGRARPAARASAGVTHAAHRLVRCHVVMSILLHPTRGSGCTGRRPAQGSLQSAGREAGHQEAGREQVQHDRRHRRHEAGGHQLVPRHAVLAEEVRDAHADRVLLVG